MREAVIVDAVRTPMGKGRESGALAGVHPVDLLATVLRSIVDRNRIDPGLIDDVIIGSVSQVGEQSSTPGRQAVLAAGFPEHVPSVTIERKCGSSQQAVEFANAGIRSGLYDMVIAGGVESMSRVPMFSARGDSDPFGPGVRSRYPNLVPQGVSAELVADRWGITRDELDQYSVRSHALADHARTSGAFDNEIVPVETAPGNFVDVDETIRAGTTSERLAQLDTVFDAPEHRAALPDIDWRITAGSSSQFADGASALLVMSAERAQELGLRPRARIIASAVVGDDPVAMLTGPIPATQKVLDIAGMSVDDIDAFEVNEAFASVPLAWQRELGVPLEKLNPAGGAIALGHPLGASGARLMTTLINHLERTGGRFGLQTMCEAGGMANATIIEILDQNGDDR